MRKLTLSGILVLGLFVQLIAQTPQSFKYQAVVRDVSGNIITNQVVAIKISILAKTETGAVVYSEIHNSTTNQFGTVTLDIGKGNIIESGIFSDIEWGSDDFFLKLEIDTTGGANFQFMGTSQLLSVPYALHTLTSEKFQTFTSAMRDTMTMVSIGSCFYNSNTNRLNLYTGYSWIELTGSCIPPLEQAHAGSDQNGILGATTVLQGNSYPSSTLARWTIINGTDGHIVEPSNPASIFIGKAGNSYTLNWTFSDSCSSTTDSVIINFAPFTCGKSFADVRDFKLYNSVLIGSQCWMTQNLNVGNRIDGNATMLDNGVIEKYCNSNLESNCDLYGGLYQWTEMMQYSTTPGTQGICTPGWHLPTDNEWKILEGTVDTQFGVGDPVWDLSGDRGMDAGGKLKATGTVYWVFPNTGATNATGFTALGGGARNTDGSFPGFQIYGRFWTSTESSTLAYRHVLNAARADIARDAANKFFGLSVRCLKD
jgi:uncharacterized protein (TIGR02145 family)